MNNDKNASVYNINKEYRIVNLKGNKCSLFFKNKQNMLLATLEGCGQVLTNILTSSERDLSEIEKGYLLSFIRAKKYSIAKEVAEFLSVSIIQYEDGREEYLSEKMLKKRIASGINFAKVFVGKLKSAHLIIPAETRNCSYNLSKAEVGVLTLEEGNSINIDLRDNEFVERLVIKDKFSGTLSLARTNLESVAIGNNCRCNLMMSDSKKCVNLQIGDVLSGNINIINSCLYALNIGYYAYADIMLSNNTVKKEIAIGDAFRGGIYAINQATDWFKIGNDCKGWVKLNNQNIISGVRNLLADNDFAGNINLSGDGSVRNINIGERLMGKIDATYAGGLERVVIGKYFNGTVDLSGAKVRQVFADYGASGVVNLQNCRQIDFLQATVDNDLQITGEIKSVDALSGDGKIMYYFRDRDNDAVKVPLLKRWYQNWHNKYRL
ncbi:MAG: hypothetical protein IJ184_03235 [Alphaproteobacteria bacterium]|nr:hypothetical protein [Alphaproteobacteria bacterium]